MRWAPDTRLVVSDVDDTIAEVFRPATQDMVLALEHLLQRGVILFLISGQSISNVFRRVLLPMNPILRKQVVVASCGGAEVHGFDADGSLRAEPLFSSGSDPDRRIDQTAWREIVNQLIKKFDLLALPLMDMATFRTSSQGNPLAVMLDDRHVQLSLDFVNWTFQPPVVDIRPSLAEEANHAFRRAGMDLEARVAGEVAIDFGLSGVDKGLPIRKFIAWGPEFRNELPHRIVLAKPGQAEVWGDRFSAHQDRSDLAMALALPPGSRKICFRNLPANDTAPCPGLRVWRGRFYLHEGLLEYLTLSDHDNGGQDA